MDTNGAEESVNVSEVSSFQRLKCGTWVGKGVLFREASLVRGVLTHRGVPLYHIVCASM